MAKLVGVLLMVGALWVAAEVLTQGTEGAFGGVLARLSGEPAPAPEERSWAGERARGAVDRARDQAERKRSRALGE